jgi:catechol 2,3-dioxygenase-like lactoylglutathione lyase family enzyme
MRLRQICLVAQDLEPAADDLCAVLGLSIAYRDPGVARYGLANVVAPIGNDFLEIVAPTRAGTSAGRYLERRGGNGGYMVILQGEDAVADRDRLQAIGVRAVDVIDRPDYRATHFHPADTGGILLSIDSVPGGDWRTPDCEWAPAGPDWRSHRRTDTSLSLAEAELQSDDPDAFAALWSKLLARPVGPERSIELANARLRFVEARDGRGRGLGGIAVRMADPAKACAEAARRALPVERDTLRVCGTRIRIIG